MTAPGGADSQAAAPATPSSVRWHGGELYLLDQRLLPFEVSYLQPRDVEQVYDAIRTLAVRGAPAIGIAAAYGLVVAMAPHQHLEGHSFIERLTGFAERLRSARPTAVNLAWACQRVVGRAHADASHSAIRDEAERIHAEDIRICRAIGEHGRSLITPGVRIVTHCNAGALAVSELGTATAPMYLSHADGVQFRVYASETRPLLQGARLTAWELDRAGIDVTLICDHTAATLMAQKEVDMAIVGTDRVTANGDVVNKIGTLNLAILCRHFNLPFYVACPSSTFDPSTATGAQVPIEERHPDEVRGTLAANVAARNPAFDVTPAALVTAFITDRGLLQPPFAQSLDTLHRN
jgi:methylthioribose-1-phosphate isomerase